MGDTPSTGMGQDQDQGRDPRMTSAQDESRDQAREQGMDGQQGQQTQHQGVHERRDTGQPKGPEPRSFDGHTGSSGEIGGQSAQGGATQDTMGQSGHNNSAAEQTDHNLRGGGVADR